MPTKVTPTTGSRITRWLQAQQLNIVATPSRSDGDTSHLGREAYCLAVREIHDWENPERIIDFSENNKAEDLKISLHVTFYDMATSSFYGNTYITPNISLPEDEDGPWDLKQLVYFTTTRNNTKCYGIVEVVARTFDRSTATERTYSLAWAALPLFAHRNIKDMDEVDHEDVDEDDYDSSLLFAGTPRSLMFYGDDWKQKAPRLNHKKRGCKLMYSMHTCLELLKARHLVPEDYAFGPTTPLPGLEPVSISSEGAAREWSIVVIVIVIFIS